MAEETLTEALEKLDDENIEKAALPEPRRVEEETQEESTFIDLSEEDVESVSPITDDEVKKTLKTVIQSQEAEKSPKPKKEPEALQNELIKP